MDQRLVFGLGVSALTLFGRYLFPTAAKPVAWAGFALGFGLMALSLLPVVRTGPAVVALLGLMLLVAGVTWQLTERPARVASPPKPSSSFEAPSPETAVSAEQKVDYGKRPQAATKPVAGLQMVVTRADAAPSVQATRAATVRQLTQLYILDHDGISSRMMAGLELPPADWLNAELEKKGENWRVRAVRGADVDTYEVAAPPTVSVRNSPGSIIAPSGGVNTIVNGMREPNSVYQADARVGTAIGPAVDEAHKRVVFKEVRFSSSVDPAQPLEFGPYLLRCSPVPIRDPAKPDAAIFMDLEENVVCEIIGRR